MLQPSSQDSLNGWITCKKDFRLQDNIQERVRVPFAENALQEYLDLDPLKH